MNRADCKALRSAALELKAWAVAVFESDPNGRCYKKHMALVKRLRAIANVEQAKLPKIGRPAQGTAEGSAK